jgi:hypothetical protein
VILHITWTLGCSAVVVFRSNISLFLLLLSVPIFRVLKSNSTHAGRNPGGKDRAIDAGHRKRTIENNESNEKGACLLAHKDY